MTELFILTIVVGALLLFAPADLLTGLRSVTWRDGLKAAGIALGVLTATYFALVFCAVLYLAVSGRL